MNYRIIGTILIVFSVVLLSFVSYRNSQKYREPVVFSPKTMLISLWNDYKREYVESSGRTIDKQRDSVTTSEGQSYTMLRAVWLDDREAFDKSWEWTKDNLQRVDDNLFSWLYGEREDGSIGILTSMGGANSASDADTDIALALIFAYSRWREPAYLDEALPIIKDIWDREVVIIKGKPYLAANNIEKTRSLDSIVVNPSYFSPYAYRIFAYLDKENDWQGLIDTSYEVLQHSIRDRLDKEKSAFIPPDWILINRANGFIFPANAGDLSTNYSYDAMRIPFRIALDYIWNSEQRAKETLSMLNFFEKEWMERGIIYANYSHDGSVFSTYEAPGFYGGIIAYFNITNPASAAVIYEKKLKTLYSPDENGWRGSLSYYDDNWAWFGLAFYNDLLPNLSPVLTIGKN